MKETATEINTALELGVPSIPAEQLEAELDGLMKEERLFDVDTPEEMVDMLPELIIELATRPSMWSLSDNSTVNLWYLNQCILVLRVYSMEIAIRYPERVILSDEDAKRLVKPIKKLRRQLKVGRTAELYKKLRKAHYNGK